jgi:hypothetical protein
MSSSFPDKTAGNAAQRDSWLFSDVAERHSLNEAPCCHQQPWGGILTKGDV